MLSLLKRWLAIGVPSKKCWRLFDRLWFGIAAQVGIGRTQRSIG
jgi:hypothetical protein